MSISPNLVIARVKAEGVTRWRDSEFEIEVSK
jgi:hypothetical protein